MVSVFSFHFSECVLDSLWFNSCVIMYTFHNSALSLSNASFFEMDHFNQLYCFYNLFIKGKAETNQVILILALFLLKTEISMLFHAHYCVHTKVLSKFGHDHI